MDHGGEQRLQRGLQKCTYFNDYHWLLAYCHITKVSIQHYSLSVCVHCILFTKHQTITSMFSSFIVSYSFNQITVNSHWTQTQHTDGLNCLRTTNEWNMWKKKRNSLIPFIQRGLIASNSWCVETLWLVAVTGKSRLRDWLTSQWLTGESAGEAMVMIANLGGMTSPGVCRSTTGPLFATITQKHRYVALTVKTVQK